MNYLWLGYQMAFWIWIIFFIASLIVGLQKIGYKASEKFDIKKWFQIILRNKNLTKLNINRALLEFSMSSSLIDILLIAIMFSYWIGEMDLGFLLSFFSILSVISTYIFWKFVDYSKYKIAYNILLLAYIISIFILLFFPNMWYIIIFSSIVNIVFRIIYIPQTVFTLNTLNKISWHENLVAEEMVINEIASTIWRILVFSLIYFIWTIDIQWVKILFSVLAITALVSILLFSSIKIPHKN